MSDYTSCGHEEQGPVKLVEDVDNEFGVELGFHILGLGAFNSKKCVDFNALDGRTQHVVGQHFHGLAGEWLTTGW